MSREAGVRRKPGSEAGVRCLGAGVPFDGPDALLLVHPGHGNSPANVIKSRTDTVFDSGVTPECQQVWLVARHAVIRFAAGRNRQEVVVVGVGGCLNRRQGLHDFGDFALVERMVMPAWRQRW